MRNRQWFSFLENPWLYRMVQSIAAPGAATQLASQLQWERRNRLHPSRVLDVGCGPISWLQQLKTELVGVDASPSYAQVFGSAGQQAIVGTADFLPLRDGLFDEVW